MMRRMLSAIMTILCLTSLASAQSVTQEIKLFNGKDLTNFYTFLQGHGKDKDPQKVFTVDKGMIRISGQTYGYIMTEKEFENYRLVVEFKWGDETWAPRLNATRDSGILFHCVGKDNVWPHSIEYQLIEGGTGDFILVGGSKLTCPVTYKGKQPYYDPKGETKTFTGGRINWYARDQEWKDVKGFRGKEDVEKPVGEWNTIEIVCDGDKITSILNGKVVNAGTGASLTKGKILFQSEGAEVFFRRIDLQPLKK